MAKEKNNAIENPASEEISPFPVFDPAEFSKIGTKNLQMATRAASAYFKGAARLNQEMMGFFNARVKRDIETAQAFMTSKTSEQAFHCQAEFVEKALRDYAEEASKCMHLAADITRDTLEPVEKRTEEMLHKFDERGAQHEAAAE